MTASVRRRFLPAAPAILAVALGAFLAPPLARADTIDLRGSVRAPAEATTIRLRDVARLQGEYAASLGGIVVLERYDPTAVRTLTVDEVREALDRAEVKWSAVDLGGRAVVLRPTLPRGFERPEAMTPATVGEEEADAPARPKPEDVAALPATELVDEATLRGAVAAFLVSAGEIPASDLRLRFEPAQREMLELPLADFRFEITPRSSLASDRVRLAVTRWRDGRPEGTAEIAVEPEVRALFPVPTRRVMPGESIAAADLRTETRWVRPSEAKRRPTLENLAGTRAERLLDAGRPIRVGDVEDVPVVRRGERVLVRCLSGGVVITLEAEAMADGRPGETIEFRKVGERDTFLATVDGPRSALLRLSPTPLG